MNNSIKSLFVVFAIFFIAACGSKSTSSNKPQKIEADIYEEYSFSTLNPITGTNIKITELGKTHKQTIVLVHGLGNNASKDWYKLLPSLSVNYHILMLDLPGFGGSDYDFNQFYTPELYASVLDWAINQYAKPKPILIGHSLGGAVSIKYASDNQSKLSKLVLIDVAGVLQESVFARYMANIQTQKRSKNPLKNVLGSLKNKVNLLTDRVIRRSDSWVDTQEILSDPSKREYLFKNRPNSNAALGLVSEDFSDEIRSILIPTLIIWGKKDPVAPLRTAKILHHHLKASTLTVIDGVGHSPMLESPELTFIELNSWLNSIDKQHNVHQSETYNQGFVNCDNKAGDLYTGSYEQITLVDCDKVIVKDVSVKRLIIKKSNAELVNVKITNGLMVKKSNLVLTNVEASGDFGFDSNANQLDIAGSDFSGEGFAIKFSGDNTVYWSVSSYLDKNGKIQYLHGREHYKKQLEL